ncbi:Acetyltransferase (GNAT) domain protein [uncultured archaeon]|nr:Acetyltransferase (GNAT) domain protein [uncultured archaeon]
MIKQLDISYLEPIFNIHQQVIFPLWNRLGRGYTSTGVNDLVAEVFKKGEVYGFFSGKELVGVVGVQKEPKSSSLEIVFLLVIPDFQGKGVGHKLMDFIDQKYSQQYDSFRLTVLTQNQHAIDFYKKLGYGIISTENKNNRMEKIPDLEKNLHKNLSKKREREMERYGRTKAYAEVAEFLQGDKRTTFSLINHVPAIVDDKIDKKGSKKQLERAKIILDHGFHRKGFNLKESWERDIFGLGHSLARLQEEKFSRAEEIFQEVLNYWNIELQNLARKGKVLSSSELDKLNLNIGKSVGLQFLYLLCTELDSKKIESIASLYGFAIKLADNLSDLKEDLAQGYINISKEDIKKYNLNLSRIKEGNFKLYQKLELERIKEYYKKADAVVESLLSEDSSQKRGLLLFKEISHSWLKQITDLYPK